MARHYHRHRWDFNCNFCVLALSLFGPTDARIVHFGAGKMTQKNQIFDRLFYVGVPTKRPLRRSAKLIKYKWISMDAQATKLAELRPRRTIQIRDKLNFMNLSCRWPFPSSPIRFDVTARANLVTSRRRSSNPKR
jgi:hypothetical protein